MLIARFLKRWREFFLKILSPQKLFFKSKTRGVAFLKEIFISNQKDKTQISKIVDIYFH